MNRRLTQASCLLLGLYLTATIVAAETPSADDIMRMVRENSKRQEASLRAQLKDEDGNKVPFTIAMDQGVLNYDFKNPDQRIQLVIGDDDVELREGVGGKMGEVPASRYGQKVRGTPITYEDLAMRPLYWSRAKLLGEENIIGRKTWKVEVQAPKGQSQYGVARLWIDQQSGAAMRIEAYGKDGRLLKVFKAQSAQKIDGRWSLKTMRIEDYDPATHKVVSRTYLDVLGSGS